MNTTPEPILEIDDQKEALETRVVSEIEQLTTDRSMRLPTRLWRVGRWIVRTALRLVLFIVGVLFGLYLILQLDWVQNQLAHQAAAYFSHKLGTTVRVERLKVTFFNRVELNGLYVEDQKRDTLLYAGKFEANVWMRQLLLQTIDLDYVGLEDAVVKVSRHGTNPAFNFQFIVDAFADTTKKKNPTDPLKWQLHLRRAALENIRVTFDDGRKGERWNVWLGSLQTSLRNIDLPHATADIIQLNITRPEVRLTKYLREVPPEPHQPDKPTNKHNTDTRKLPFTLNLDRMAINEGKFWLDDLEKQPLNLPACIDFKRLALSAINLQAHGIKFENDVLAVQFDDIKATERSGFHARRGYGALRVTATKATMAHCELFTNESRLGDSVAIEYAGGISDFPDFEDKVKLHVHARNCAITGRDLAYFVPKFQEDAYWKSHFHEQLNINLDAEGIVNKLHLTNIDAKIGDETRVRGDIRITDAAHPKQLYIEAHLSELVSSAVGVRHFVPADAQAALTDAFMKLGAMRFVGNFKGYPTDFIANGTLNTDLGAVTTDLALNLEGGMAKARYEGRIELSDLDIKTLANNPDLGRATATLKLQGTGLNAATVRTDIRGQLAAFDFKGYRYRAIALDGLLDRKQFDGHVASLDPNIDLDAKGSINFNNTLPKIDIEGWLRNLDLQKLHLSPLPYRINGKLGMNTVGNNIDNITGSLAAYQLNVRRDTVLFSLDYLKLLAENTPNGDSAAERRISFDSEIADGTLNGHFAPSRMVGAVKAFFCRRFYQFADAFNACTPADTLASEQQFRFNVRMDDSRSLFRLFDLPIDRIVQRTIVRGNFDSRKFFYGSAIAPALKTSGLLLRNIDVNFAIDNDENYLEGTVGSTRMGDSLAISPINVRASVEGDILRTDLHTNYVNRDLYNVNIHGQLTKERSADSASTNRFEVRFDSSYFYVLNRRWEIAKNESLEFGPRYIRTDSFSIRNEVQSIVATAPGGTGLKLHLNDISGQWLSNRLNLKELKFAGLISGDATAANIFDQSGIKADIHIDSLAVNGLKWGFLNATATTDTFNSSIAVKLQLEDRAAHPILVQGLYYPPVAARRKGKPANFFDVELTANDYPVGLAELFLHKEISETAGSFDANLHLFGTPERIHTRGTIDVRDAAVKINFLQNRIFAPKVHAVASDSVIDFTNTALFDRNGNRATLIGGLTHQYLKHLGTNIVISSPRFQILDTKAGDNDVFYGTGIGKARIEILGEFGKTDMKIDVETYKGTNIVFPLGSGGQDVKAVSFIKFVKPERDTVRAVARTEKDLEPDGLNLDMRINTNQDARFELIFDEASGEKMRATGNGSIELHLTRTGDFAMFGDYTVDEGDYLFTYQNLIAINKPFTVKRGGSVSWTGSPYDAQIDITASYKDLRAAPYNLISEFLTKDDEIKNAKRSTAVALDLQLSGTLLHPDINFNFDFPEVGSSLKGYLDNKMRILHEDKNALNRQVFGLMVFKNFIPEQSSLINGNEVTTGVNTLTEVLTSQLSTYISGALSEVIGSDVSVDVNYKLYDNEQSATVDNTTNRRPNSSSEVQLGVKFNPFKRAYVNVGGNLDTGLGSTSASSSTSGTSSTANNASNTVGGNFTFEYWLNPEGNMKLRIYSRDETDIVGRRNRTGAGITFRREYDSMAAFLNGIKKEAKRK